MTAKSVAWSKRDPHTLLSGGTKGGKTRLKPRLITEHKSRRFVFVFLASCDDGSAFVKLRDLSAKQFSKRDFIFIIELDFLIDPEVF